MKTQINEPVRPLSSVELWMVKRNLEYAKTEGVAPVVSRLRAQGYNRVANAVAATGGEAK